MEYPGYGFFTHQISDGKMDYDVKITCSAKRIARNAKFTFEHIIRPKRLGGLGFTSDQVIIFGRSMGSGPSCYLARHF
jgi:hypothetical protein